jgi:hypothetical protein
MKKILTTTGFIAVALIMVMPFANLALAATWGYEQTFEGLSVGNLNGQDSWTNGAGDGNITVSTEQAYTGTKAVRFAPDTSPYSIRTVTDANTDGTQFFVAARVSALSQQPLTLYLWGNNGATRIGDIYFNAPSTGDWSFRQGGGAEAYTDLGNISANTWYCVGIEFDFTNDRVRLNIDGGAFSSYISTATSFSEIDTVWIGVSDNGGTATSYIDNFTATAGCGYVAPSAAPIQYDILIFSIIVPPRDLFIV